ncbi:hypothetical protein Tco_0850462, partial [Tanacetum coccineum]
DTGGRGGSKKDMNKETSGSKVVGSSSKSNDDRVSVNEEDTSSIAAKIRDMERRMLEGKRVLSGDD